MLQRLTGQELLDAQDRTSIDETRPVLVGVGPAEFSTSTDLEAWPSIIWDTNLFYRDLGVHPKAPRDVIRKAYTEADGELDIRLTMIASVLLNPKRRLTYDLVPLGKLFLDDEIETAIRRQAAGEASTATAEGDDVDVQALNDHIDSLRERPDELPEYTEREDCYPWSYYLMQSTSTDVKRLSAWRTALIAGLSEQKKAFDIPSKLGIGFKGTDEESPIGFAKIGYRMVCLIDDQLELSEASIATAVGLIVNHQHTTSTQPTHNPTQ